MPRFRHVPRVALLGYLSISLLACNEGKDGPAFSDLGSPKAGDTDFISAVPDGSGARGELTLDGAVESSGPPQGSGGTTAAPNGTGSTTGAENDAGTSVDAQRAISEADILKVDGDRLYALSRFSGLSIIDITNSGELRLLGQHRTSAMPFEMYVEGARAYVMYNGWGHYDVTSDGNWSWNTSSRIQALDLTDPQNILLLGEQDMPGELSDSRKVGDVLYLVTYENGYCWGCETATNTRVSSFNVADANEFRSIDELRLTDTNGYFGKRSISVTAERIYVSGWDWSGKESGVIDVVDITDPTGRLTAGAEVSIAGPVESRWQIDEFDGVLRVISQPGGWNTQSAPVVETFTVKNASEVSPLGSLQMQLPRPEDLRSVRFDGERAYAITFQQTDPLFTLDLSDPAAPQQVGELQIPGWVYHMEPRGDRIYALGFDDAENGGALHVSLFDVSSLSAPVQVARVNFGGQWASFSEDQDRIHKAFNIMPNEGLILVPFSGWDYAEQTADEQYCSSGTYLSGIQLIDLGDDTLTLRGVAPQVGEARRGFLANGALFGLSDNAVQTFDITDRDAPAALGQLELARNVSSIRVMGDSMLRFGHDWWTGTTTLDLAALDRVDQAEPLGDIDLSQFELADEDCYGYSYWEDQVFVAGEFAYVPRRSIRWGGATDVPTQDGTSPAAKAERQRLETITLFVVSLADRNRPKVTGRVIVATENDDQSLTGITKTDSALLIGRQQGYPVYDPTTGETSGATLSYDVLSLDDPAEPQVVSTIEVPAGIANGGYGYNFSGCTIDVGWGWWGGYGYGYGSSRQTLVSGDVVASQHQVPLGDGSNRVRYYLDLLDVSDPTTPVLQTPVNIPGGLVDFDKETGRLITVDYLLEERTAKSWDECQTGAFVSDRQVCQVYRRSVNTLQLEEGTARLLDSALLDDGDTFASSVAVSHDRIFAYYSAGGSDSSLRSFAVRSSGLLEELPAVTPEVSTWANVFARGKRAFLSSEGRMTIVDTSDKSTPSQTAFEMGGYYCSSLEVSTSHAYCALGEQGVQAFPLP